MKRLNFSLPDFTRFSWVSDQARIIWKPRIDKIREAWENIVWLSVVHSIRPCCLISIRPEELPKDAEIWTALGLTALPLRLEGIPNYAYSNRSINYQSGQ